MLDDSADPNTTTMILPHNLTLELGLFIGIAYTSLSWCSNDLVSAEEGDGPSGDDDDPVGTAARASAQMFPSSFKELIECASKNSSSSEDITVLT